MAGWWWWGGGGGGVVVGWWWWEGLVAGGLWLYVRSCRYSQLTY